MVFGLVHIHYSRCGTLGMPNIISLASKLCQSQCLRGLYLTAILYNAQHPSSPPTKKATETRLGVHDGHFTTKSFVKSKAVSALFCCESRSFSRISRTVKTIGGSLIINYVLFSFKLPQVCSKNLYRKGGAIKKWTPLFKPLQFFH